MSWIRPSAWASGFDKQPQQMPRGCRSLQTTASVPRSRSRDNPSLFQTPWNKECWEGPTDGSTFGLDTLHMGVVKSRIGGPVCGILPGLWEKQREYVSRLHKQAKATRTELQVGFNLPFGSFKCDYRPPRNQLWFHKR